MEPVVVGNESAVWLSKAASQVRSSTVQTPTSSMSLRSGLGEAYFHRWMNWSPRQSDVQNLASFSTLEPRHSPENDTERNEERLISYLPYARRLYHANGAPTRTTPAAPHTHHP